MNAIQPAAEFTDTLIEKDVFEREILVLLGRDLHLSQSFALEQCRKYVDTIIAMWMDGFSIRYTFEHLKVLLIEAAKSDEELKWQINPDLLKPAKPASKAIVELVASNPTQPSEEGQSEEETFFGTVKWYSAKKGFGFIVSDELEGDIFVHHKEIEGKGFKKLSTGEDVFFEIIETDRGTEAQRVRRQQ